PGDHRYGDRYRRRETSGTNHGRPKKDPRHPRCPAPQQDLGIALSSRQGNHIDFYGDISRQPRHFYGRARRRSTLEQSSVDLIHLSKLRHVLEVDGGFYHFVPATARSLQDSGKILHDLLSLLINTAANKIAAGRVKADLAGDKKEAIGFDGLGIWPNSFGCVRGRNRFSGLPTHSLASKW